MNKYMVLFNVKGEPRQYIIVKENTLESRLADMRKTGTTIKEVIPWDMRPMTYEELYCER